MNTNNLKSAVAEIQAEIDRLTQVLDALKLLIGREDGRRTSYAAPGEVAVPVVVASDPPAPAERSRASQAAQVGRLCPECGERELEANKRFCETCRRARRTASVRRRSGASLGAVSPTQEAPEPHPPTGGEDDDPNTGYLVAVSDMGEPVTVLDAAAELDLEPGAVAEMFAGWIEAGQMTQPKDGYFRVSRRRVSQQ